MTGRTVTIEANTGQPMTVDHIIPQAQGGETVFDNLCFACRHCNEFKGSATRIQDPLTGETVALFHPRQQTSTIFSGTRPVQCLSV